MDNNQITKEFVVFIPNAINPYGYELINIMAYPSGFVYRFRFDERYVSEQIKSNLSNVIGKEAYIVLRDKITAKFYPIRFCTIKDASKIGKVYYFEYELKQLFDYDSDESLRIQQLDNFNKVFSKLHVSEIKNNLASQDMTPLVLLSNYEPDIKNQNYSGSISEKDHERWGNIISIIRDLKLYENVEFIKFVNVINMKNRKAAEIKNNALQLFENQDYELRVLQYIPKQINGDKINSPRDIEILVDENYINRIRPKQRAVGKYDVLKFLFRTNSGSGGKRSFVDIYHIAKTEAESSIEPKLHIPIIIKKSLRYTILIFILTVLSFLIYISPGLITEAVKLDERTIKDITIITLTISLIDFFNQIRGYLRK